MAQDLVIQGGALPTFLLDRCVAATGARSVQPQPPQVTPGTVKRGWPAP